MKSQVLHTVWCDISGEAAGEICNWSLLGVKGQTRILLIQHQRAVDHCDIQQDPSISQNKYFSLTLFPALVRGRLCDVYQVVVESLPQGKVLWS